MSRNNLDVVYDDLNFYKNRNIAGFGILNHLQNYVKAVFTLDLRALALLRIGMAFLVLVDLSIRSTDLVAHYTNAGVVPLDMLFRYGWGTYSFSLHTISGLWQVQVALFLLEAVFAVFLMFGINTRLASVMVWLLHMSLQNRNPYILQGGDDLFRMILFWGMFLPWDKRYSVQGRQDQEGGNSFFGLAGVGYLLQICFLYFFTAMLKTSPEWRSDFTALYYALSLDQMVFPVGKLLYRYPELMKSLTAFVFYMELLVPLLFFMPVFTRTFRVTGFLLIIGLHLGISMTLFVGLFFMIGIITVFGLFPESWMSWFDRKTARLQQALAVYADRTREWLQRLVQVRVSSGRRLLSPTTKEFVRDTFLFFCLIYIFCWNMQNIGMFKGVTDRADSIGQTLRLDQNWGMFAPSVFKDDGWYILEGTTVTGDKIDLNREGQPVSYEKPESVVSLFKNDRWRKYSENYLFVSNSFMRPAYSNFVLDHWNADHPDKAITRLEVIYMKEVTQPDYRQAVPTREVLAVTELNEEEQ
jgi:hypothetical protein